MKDIEYSALHDLFNDWITSIPDRKVDLKQIKIYRVDEVHHKEKTVASLTVTDTENLQQKRMKAVVPDMWAERLEQARVFYKTADGCRFVPTAEVRGHTMPDYFHYHQCDNEDLMIDERDAEDMKLAEKFRKMDSAIFVARKNVNGYSELVGIKGSAKHLTIIDITASLDQKYHLTFSTNYPDSLELDFSFQCRCPKWKTADGTPFCLSINDSITGRRSIRVDVVAEIRGRAFIIDSLEISHRTSQNASVIAERISGMIELQHYIVLNTYVDAKTVAGNCLKYVPKKTRQKANDLINIVDVNPIDAAYDAMDECGLFNLKQKKHKTHSYDGGRRKYEIALGATLKCC